MIGIVGNNTEKHTWTEIRVVFHVVAYNVEMIGIVGNNAEELPQHKQNSIQIFCEPLLKGTIYIN